ncbi:S1 family peptidase [Cellulomonas sp. HD19AZ1]|nr:S1 family peptidase [Cellulomonas sp. HD19AZ1]
MRSAERGAAVALVTLLAAAGCTGPAAEGLPAGAYVAVLNASAAPSRTWANTFCSGALVAPDLVVTAAHCLRDGPLPDVLVGEHDLCADPVAGERRAVVRRLLGEGPAAELALLRLGQPVAADVAEVASLPDIGTTTVAVGWGRVDTDQRRPCQAKTMPLRVVDGHECTPVLAAADDADRAPGRWVCMTPTGTQNTCIGDSGSGAYTLKGGRLRLQGITLGGLGCGPDEPGLYASPDAVAVLLQQAGQPGAS